MRKVALGLVGIIACALGPIALSAVDSLGLAGCGPLANDPSEDAAAGGGSSGGGSGSGSSSGSSGGEDSGTPPAGDSGAGSKDSGGSTGQDGSSGSSSGGGGDEAGGQDAPTGGDDAPQAQCTPVTTWVSGAGIDHSAWSATAIATPASDGNTEDAVTTNAFDNNLTTRWSTGAAQTATAGLYFTLNLGSVQSFDQIALFYPSAGDAGVTDFPAEYSIGVGSSVDGPFTTVATGAGGSPTVSCFSPQSAQFIQIKETGSSPVASWLSIYEMQVFAN